MAARQLDDVLGLEQVVDVVDDVDVLGADLLEELERFGDRADERATRQHVDALRLEAEHADARGDARDLTQALDDDRRASSRVRSRSAPVITTTEAGSKWSETPDAGGHQLDALVDVVGAGEHDPGG